jgi:uncharacterized C2H2 Zn-finger protein
MFCRLRFYSKPDFIIFQSLPEEQYGFPRIKKSISDVKSYIFFRKMTIMGLYICERCDVCFEQKSHLIRHLERKKICQAIISTKDLDRNILIEKVKEKNNKDTGKNFNCTKCNKIFNERKLECDLFNELYRI